MSLHGRSPRIWLRAALTAAVIAGSCSKAGNPPSDESSAPGRPEPDTTAWVSVYDSDKAWNGYTLTLHNRRIPVLMDMNGRVVHSWPRARVKSRVRLLPDGSLLGIALGRAVFEYDWHGDLVWQHRPDGAIPHHDVIRTANGNTLFVTRRVGEPIDELLEVDRGGRLVWQWLAAEHLASYLDRSPDRKDLTHINSVQELPENSWHRQGDARFRPGNLLISARNMNLVFLVDRDTSQVVWTFDEALDFQHEALMIGPGLPGHGNILIFNNGYHRLHTDPRSRIVEIDPTSHAVIWEYASDGFYSPEAGVEQPLPNGNVLIGSTRGARAFEITRGGEIVWEWTPPFDPRRPRRYSYDYCPQLAAMERPREAAVRPPDGYRWVDRNAYRFARRSGRRNVRINGEKRSVLKTNNVCRRLFLPAAATVEVGFGLASQRGRHPDSSRYAIRFGLRLRRESSDGEIRLLEETVESGQVVWRERILGLEEYAHEWVELCVETEEVGAPGKATEELAFWSQPAVSSADVVRRYAEARQPPDDLTAEEAEARKQHLKALGYVD